MIEKTFHEIEQEAWGQRAAYYDDLFADISSQAIADILDGLGSINGKRHLDIACGTGHLVAAASQRGAISEGTDFSQPMIDVAKKNYPEERFRQADATLLPYDDESFDAVTCAFGLSHMEYPAAAITEVFRILTPGGRFAFTLWFGPNDGNELLAITEHAVAAHAVTTVPLPNSWTQLRFADRLECTKAVRRAGFDEPDFERLPIIWTSQNGQDILAIVDKISVRGKMVIDSQPPATKQRIQEAILLEAEARRTNGAISMKWPALLTLVQNPQLAEEEKNPVETA